MDGLALIFRSSPSLRVQRAAQHWRRCRRASPRHGSAADPAGAGCRARPAPPEPPPTEPARAEPPPAEQPADRARRRPGRACRRSRRAANPRGARARSPGRTAATLEENSARAGPSGSAGWRWGSAGCCWCSIPSSRVSSARRVRIALGAVFAFVLVAAGEWFRRSERTSRCRHPGRPHPRHPDRRGHGQRLRHGLCGARALPVHRFPRSLRHTGRHRRRHHACSRAARTRAGRPGPCRCPGDAAADRLAAAQPVAGRALSRGGGGGRLRARTPSPLALACLRDGRRRGTVGLRAAGSARQRHARRLGVGAARPYRPAARPGSRCSWPSSRT